jgi:hypothetical protein
VIVVGLVRNAMWSLLCNKMRCHLRNGQAKVASGLACIWAPSLAIVMHFEFTIPINIDQLSATLVGSHRPPKQSMMMRTTRYGLHESCLVHCRCQHSASNARERGDHPASANEDRTRVLWFELQAARPCFRFSLITSMNTCEIGWL